MLLALLDRAANSVVAFRYRDTPDALSSQLGLIADDLAEVDGYELIGTREEIEVERENADGEKEKTGEVRTEYGLKPLAVATLALYGYKVQRDRADKLERRVQNLEQRIARLEGVIEKCGL